MKPQICIKCRGQFYGTISKKWHKPEFNYKISNKEMSCEMDFEDFVKALKQEIGSMEEFRTALKEEIDSVTWTFKKETFGKKLDNAWIVNKEIFEKSIDGAVQRVISGAKAESAKVIKR